MVLLAHPLFDLRAGAPVVDLPGAHRVQPKPGEPH